MKKRMLKVVVFLISALLLISCSKKEQKVDENTTFLYYLNKDETKLLEEEIVLQEDAGEQYQQLLEGLWNKSIFKNLVLTRRQLRGKILYLSFDTSYSELTKTSEVLVRAALVKTLCQAQNVDGLVIRVDGNNLKDATGREIGILEPLNFADNEGNEITSFEKTTLILYFSNKSGDELKKEKRTLVYNSNVSIAKLVMEQLLKGPEDSDYLAVMNSGTKILSVTVTDRICYVDLSSDFLTLQGKVTPETTIYAIVNSLTALYEVDKVQISVEGDSNVMFGEMLDLNTVFERNQGMID